MITKFEQSDFNILASDTIHKYINNGYRIDPYESVIDKDKDKFCTFKAVLKTEEDGVEYKTVVTINEIKSNNSVMYKKVDYANGFVYSESHKYKSVNKFECKCPSAIDKSPTTDDKSKQESDDELEDSLIKVVRYIFGR